MAHEMRAGSLFSGIGGLDLGLHRAGITHAFFCESDPWRRSVLAHHWPGVPIYHDVRDVGRRRDELADAVGGTEPSGVRRDGPVSIAGTEGRWEERADSPDRVDLLCGGFPCQDLSVAGNRKGLAGARSGLFHEFARIAESLRPRWLLVENVPGLLSSNSGRDFGIVLGTLADIGYGLGWRVVDSRFFGVPQRRRRVFIVGALAVDDPRAAAECAGQILAVGTRCPGHPPTGTEAREGTADPFTVSTLQGGGGSPRGHRNDAEGAAGGHLVTAFSHTQGLDAQPSDSAWPSLRKNGGGQGVGVGVRRLTPIECERLQAWPDGWTNPDGKAPDSRRYAACGDGVTATVSEWIGRRMVAA